MQNQTEKLLITAKLCRIGSFDPNLKQKRNKEKLKN